MVVVRHIPGKLKAEGLAYNMGGIDTPFQGIGALNPRMGYQVGSSDIPGIPGVGKAMRDVEFPTFSEGVNQEFPSNELGAIDTTVQEDLFQQQAEIKFKKQLCLL